MVRSVKRVGAGLAVIFAVCFASCHTVVLNTPASIRLAEPRSERSASFVVAPDSLDMSFSTGSTAAGLANRFTMEVGQSLDRYGRAYIAQAFAPVSGSGSELKVVAEVLHFTIERGAALIDCNFRVTQGEQILFEKKYEVSGPPRSGLPGNPLPQMPGGIATEGSVKVITNSLQRTLHDVLTLSLQSFISDLWLEFNSADNNAVVTESN